MAAGGWVRPKSSGGGLYRSDLGPIDRLMVQLQGDVEENIESLCPNNSFG